MRRSAHRRAFLLAAAAVVLLPVAALAADPVEVAPANYKVAIDNADVRVLDVTLAPGSKTPLHSHPDYLGVAFPDCKVKFTGADGESVVAEIKAGEVLWRPAETHTVENLGGECHVLNVELKRPAAKAG